MITVDTRERHPYRFAQHGAKTARATVAAGDYAIHAHDGSLIAAVERKSLDNLAATLSDGTLALPAATAGRAAARRHRRRGPLRGAVQAGTRRRHWLADQLARLQVRYPEVQLVFADSRRYGEDWTYRFLTTALADSHEPSLNG
jgi:hypothetical protein